MRQYTLSFLINDERGGGTVMGLFWFITLVGICGLAVDFTDGFRYRTMLQSTADTAALAGAIDLPDKGAVRASAVANASANMYADENGSVLMPEDITLGVWDHENREFTPEDFAPPDMPLDAVHVMARRSQLNDNAVPVNFLRIVGVRLWNINTQAIAQRFIPECLRDGLIAREYVDISSNNAFTNKICLHGQMGVNLQQNNYFESGVNVTMPNLDMLEVPSGEDGNNVGLNAALLEQIRDPRMVNHVEEIMTSYLDPSTSPWLPAYIAPTTTVTAVNSVGQFDWATVSPGNVYYFSCKNEKELLLIPEGFVLSSVMIIADCQIQIGANAVVINSFIGSRASSHLPTAKFPDHVRQNASITTAANVQLGLPDNCAPGNGVQIFSNSSMAFASSTGFDGVQLVAGGDISLGARDQGINGISAQSGGTIYMTSNNAFGLCSGGAPGLFTVWYYRLVL